jgi:hypothetical protein
LKAAAANFKPAKVVNQALQTGASVVAEALVPEVFSAVE